jgi:hypothetical protein
MKYSFDDIRPMRVNGGKSAPDVSPSAQKTSAPKAPPKEIEKPILVKKTETIEKKATEVSRVKIPAVEVPWTNEPPHKAHVSSPPTRPGAPFGERINRKGWRYVLWCLLILGGIGLLLIVGNMVRRATITITPRVLTGTVSEEVALTQSGSFPETIPFETMSISETLDKSILATETTTIDQKARGTIVIYNKTSAVQDLIAGTRFSAPNGKIYTLESKVHVPAQKKAGTPGQLEATIVAAETGESYNSDPVDFSIVAYKGTSKYTTVFARSKGVIAGGTSGTAFTLSNDDLEQAKSEVNDLLTQKLVANASKQVPSGYRFFKDAAVLTTTVTLPEKYSSHASITVHGEGKLTAVLIPEKAFKYVLAHALSEEVTPDTKLEEPDVTGLTVALKESDAASLGTDRTVSVIISGTATILFSIDQGAIARKTIGIPKTDLLDTVAKEPGVGGATFSLFPWYSKYLPLEQERVHVILK